MPRQPRPACSATSLCETVVKTLFKAVSDPEYLVRFAAAEAILLIHDIDEGLSSFVELYSYLSTDPTSVGEKRSIGDRYRHRGVDMLWGIIEEAKRRDG